MVSIETIRQFVKTHPRKAVIVAVAVIVYAAVNVWVYRVATSGRASSPSTAPIRVDTDKSLAPQARDVKPTATPTPTPRPTGPGTFACSPEGVCNLYSDEMRKTSCTTTFADTLCLDQCTDSTKRCSK